MGISTVSLLTTSRQNSAGSSPSSIGSSSISTADGSITVGDRSPTPWQHFFYTKIFTNSAIACEKQMLKGWVICQWNFTTHVFL